MNIEALWDRYAKALKAIPGGTTASQKRNAEVTYGAAYQALVEAGEVRQIPRKHRNYRTGKQVRK